MTGAERDKTMNDEMHLTEEELESMADELIEQAAEADLANQQEDRDQQ